MRFVISKEDIDELTATAIYAAHRSGDVEVMSVFQHRRSVCDLIGKFIHVIVNTPYDPGQVISYSEVAAGFYTEFTGPTRDHIEFIIHDMYIALSTLLGTWIDRDWLYGIDARWESSLMSEPVIDCFVIIALISPTAAAQFSDMFSATKIIDFLNAKQY